MPDWDNGKLQTCTSNSDVFIFFQMRRAQLKKLLEDEYRMYEQELQQQGKAFYIKRE